MATIQFKAKVKTIGTGADACRYIAVPILTRSHCDMPAFRAHPKYGAIANSDIFAGALAGIRAGLLSVKDFRRGGIGMRLDRLPENVTVNESGFLARVTVTV